MGNFLVATLPKELLVHILQFVPFGGRKLLAVSRATQAFVIASHKLLINSGHLIDPTIDIPRRNCYFKLTADGKADYLSAEVNLRLVRDNPSSQNYFLVYGVADYTKLFKRIQKYRRYLDGAIGYEQGTKKALKLSEVEMTNFRAADDLGEMVSMISLNSSLDSVRRKSIIKYLIDHNRTVTRDVRKIHGYINCLAKLETKYGRIKPILGTHKAKFVIICSNQSLAQYHKILTKNYLRILSLPSIIDRPGFQIIFYDAASSKLFWRSDHFAITEFMKMSKNMLESQGNYIIKSKIGCIYPIATRIVHIPAKYIRDGQLMIPTLRDGIMTELVY